MAFNPMLATNANLDKFDGPYMGSLKLEGVRGEVFCEGGLLTRQLKPFRNWQLNERMAPVVKWCNNNHITLEGEFYKHGWDFTRIDSACDRGDNEDGGQLEFWVHDALPDDGNVYSFEERVSFMRWAVSAMQQAGMGFVQICEQWKVETADQALQAYTYAIEQGYEGLVLKKPKLHYKNGRSTVKGGHFLRLKPEDPFDAFVLEIVERQENLCESEVNELGYLKKRQDKELKAGMGIAQTAVVYCPALDRIIRVSLTRGLKDTEETDKGPSRLQIWESRDEYIGKGIRFVGIPVKGMAPRSPRFDSWRNDIEPLLAVHHESDCLLATFETDVQNQWFSDMADPIDMDNFVSLWKKGYSLGKA